MRTAKVTVTFKDGVLDPQGKTIFNALRDLGYNNLEKVATGKVFSLAINSDDIDDVKKQVNEICQKLLANPVIEQYQIEVE